MPNLHPQRPVDRLAPSALCIDHDEPHDVNGLGYRGEGDLLTMALHDVDETGHSESIAHGVGWPKGREFGVGRHHSLFRSDIPLRARHAYVPRRAVTTSWRLELLGLDETVDQQDLLLRFMGAGHDRRPGIVSLTLTPVRVKGNIVHKGKHFRDNGAHPLWVVLAISTYGQQLDGRVESTHDLRPFASLFGIGFGRAWVANLPWPIVLIAQLPIPHPKRRLISMLTPQVCIGCVPREVTVFQPGGCLLQCPCPHGKVEVRFGADPPTEGDEFCCAESIVGWPAEMQINLLRTLLLRADAIQPVVAGPGTTSRPANQRGPEIAYPGGYVGAQACCVRILCRGVVEAPF